MSPSAAGTPMDIGAALAKRKHPVHGVFIVSGAPTIVFLTVCTKHKVPWLAYASGAFFDCRWVEGGVNGTPPTAAEVAPRERALFNEVSVLFPLLTIFKGYAYIVPYLKREEDVFLKTIIPSRKMTTKYLGGRHEEGKS